MHILKTETKIYSFAELSPEAQQHAMEKASEAAGGFFGEDLSFEFDNYADAAALLGWNIRTRFVKLLGGGTRRAPAIYFSGFWSQGDGACCEGVWRAADCDAAKLKAEFPTDKALHDIADSFARVADIYANASFSVKHRGHYYHSGCTEFDIESGVDRDSNSNCASDDAFHARNGAADDLKDAARAFMDWIYSRLKSEYEYQNGEEVLRETCETAGEVFDEQGNRA